jgi:hypothetical protein
MVAEIKAEAFPFFEEWDSMDHEEFYHYTSLTAARSILTNRVLWASDVPMLSWIVSFYFLLGFTAE